MPAHTTPAAIGEAKKSDGTRVLAVEWRANRLCDGLAKQSAALDQPPRVVTRLLASAYEAVRHSARRLGAVTFEANNHRVTVVDEDGNSSTKVLRDSQDKPRQAAVANSSRAQNLKPALPAKVRKPVAPWTPDIEPRAPQSRRRWKQREAELERERLCTRVQEIGSRLRPSANRPASERLAELKARVLHT